MIRLRFLLALMVTILATMGHAGATPKGPEIRLRATLDGIQIEYSFARPVTEFRLGSEMPPDKARLSIETAGVALARGRLVGDQPFRHAIVHIRPDSGDTPATYPLLRAVPGGGYVLYMPYLTSARPADARVRISGPSSHDGRNDALDGYLLLGARPVRKGPASFHFAAGMPPEIQAELVQRAQQIVAAFAARMGKRVPATPTLIVTYEQRSARWFNRGEATPNGVIFMRIGAAAADLNNAAFKAAYTRFLAHELFHLWIPFGGGSRDDWWLQEGMAEYAALSVGARLWPDEIDVQKAIGSALGSCAMTLGDGSISTIDTTRKLASRYPCGLAIQWLVDVHGKSGTDIFGLWRKLSSMSNRSRPFGPPDFAELVRTQAPGATVAIDSILAGSNAGRWEALVQSTISAGVDIRIEPPSPFLLRVSAAKALVLSACGEIRGVGEDQRGLYIQSPPECSAFGADVVIESAGNVPPMADPQGFYATVRTKCAAGDKIPLTVTRQGGRKSFEMPCRIATDPAAPSFVVAKALPAR